MITHIKGKLSELYPTDAIVEVAGIGYMLHISLATFAELEPKKNQEVFIYTHLQVREDAHNLYGFYSKQEREVFRLLISVSGVGANTARMILSSLSVEEVQQAIATENVLALKNVKGIGAKSAQRIIIDLKDKIQLHFDTETILQAEDNTLKDEALSALEVLGFARKPAEKLVAQMLSEDPSTSIESLIKNALKRL